MRKFESNNEYHGNAEWIGSTSLKIYDKSPMHFKHNLEHPEPSEPMGYLDFGNASHVMTFQPHLFSSEILVLDLNDKPEPDKTFASKENKAWKERWIETVRLSGKPLIDNMQKQAIEDMKSVLDADPFIREHLYDKTGVAEQSYYIEYLIPGTDLKTKIKCKPDWETDYAIFDYKSAKDASYYGFMKAVSSLLYGMSAAMYREIVSIETGLLKPFVWIAQEKEPPYAAAIYVASAEDLRKGMMKFLQLLTNHAMCIEANYWPGYTAFGTQRADFRFNGAQISNTKWDNEALALASGAITDEIIQVRKI